MIALIMKNILVARRARQKSTNVGNFKIDLGA